MNILRVLVHAFKVLLYKSIDSNGIGSFETIKISQRLDKLILNMQIRNYSIYKNQYN